MRVRVKRFGNHPDTVYGPVSQESAEKLVLAHAHDGDVEEVSIEPNDQSERTTAAPTAHGIHFHGQPGREEAIEKISEFARGCAVPHFARSGPVSPRIPIESIALHAERCEQRSTRKVSCGSAESGTYAPVTVPGRDWRMLLGLIRMSAHLAERG